jgi:phospholipase D1/2
VQRVTNDVDAIAMQRVSETQSNLFEPGRTCWRVEQATRAEFLIDGNAYFRAFAQAARKAQRSILITGWEFHSRTRLLCAEDNGGTELLLGGFLNDLVRERRGLEIHILIWDYPVLFGIDREWAPILGLGWKPRRRVHFRHDNTHPVGGCHHQKVVVIDDAVAFNGGIDLTVRRWDTCAHEAGTAQRSSLGSPYPPFHDLMMAVEGDAARSLGDLVRERWRLATGDTLEPVVSRKRRWLQRGRRPVVPAASVWPESLGGSLRDVRVAISRTSPPVNGHGDVREVEALYTDMIARARSSIYIENQYFTADKIGAALEARLIEADGPEIIVVLRKLSHGWLEELTMEALRTRLIARLKAADQYDRLRVVYPHIEGLKEGTCIDVHSKMMIVDDDVVRIGSANLANRSMGLDTECDLTVESEGRADIHQAISKLRATLLAEHLGASPEQVHRAVERTGSLRGAIAELHRDGRTLLSLDHVAPTESILSVASVVDPEKPVALADLMNIFSAPSETPVSESAPAWGKIVLITAVVAGLAALWQFTPLAELFDARRIVAWAREFGGYWWAPLITVLAYTPASLTMFPRSPITLFAVVAFGPAMGFVYAMLGVELAGWVTYVAGQQLNRDTVRRIAGRKLNDMINVLRTRGLIAITALRLVPLAPFTVEGVVAGAVGIKLWHFMVGTAIGILPGTLAATVFGDQLQAALEDPARVNYWLIGGILAVMALMTWWVRRWLMQPARDESVATPAAPKQSSSGHGVGNTSAI